MKAVTLVKSHTSKRFR